MKKVLFISFQDFHNIFDGGSLANRRNVEMAVNVLGKENVDCFFINDNRKKNSIVSMLQSAILFPFGYFYGLTPGKIRTIINMANKYDYIFINTSILGIISKKLKKHGYKGIIINFFHNNCINCYTIYNVIISIKLPLG